MCINFFRCSWERIWLGYNTGEWIYETFMLSMTFYLLYYILFTITFYLLLHFIYHLQLLSIRQTRFSCDTRREVIFCLKISRKKIKIERFGKLLDKSRIRISRRRWRISSPGAPSLARNLRASAARHTQPRSARYRNVGRRVYRDRNVARVFRDFLSETRVTRAYIAVQCRAMTVWSVHDEVPQPISP